MNHDEPLPDDAGRLRTLGDALHEIEEQAAHAPRGTDDDALAAHVLRTARVLRRRHRTARVALTAACVAAVAGGAALVASLPRPPERRPVAVSPSTPSPTSTAHSPACGERLVLPQSVEGLTLVSTAFPDAAGRPTASSASAEPGARTFADSRAFATTVLGSIEVTNRSTGTEHQAGGGSGYSQTLLVREGVVVARTTMEPFPLGVAGVLEPGETLPAPGLFPTPCPTGGSQGEDAAHLSDVPDGDYELYAILSPSDDGATAQAVGGPWDISIGESDGTGTTGTDALPRCGETYVPPAASSDLVLVSAAFQDDGGRALSSAPAGAAPFATDLTGSVLPLDVRNDSPRRADGTMSTAVSLTIVQDGKVVAAPREISSPPLTLDLGRGEAAPLAPVAPEPCDGTTLQAGDYDVYATAGAHLADGSAPVAVGGPWRVHLGEVPLGDDVPAQVLTCGASTSELAASRAPFTLDLDQNRNVDPVHGADPMPQVQLDGDREGMTLVSAQTAAVRDDVVIASVATDVSRKKTRGRFRQSGTIDLDLPGTGCTGSRLPSGPVTLVTVVELRPGGGEPVLVVSNRWDTSMP